MKLFSPDGALYKFMDQFKDLIIFNFMWILFSIPIITMGASTVAACSVGMKMAKGEEGYIARTFVKEFKRNWKQGTLAWLIFLVIGYAIYMDKEILRVQSNPSILVIIFMAVAIFAAILCFSYTFALLSRYENTVIGAIKNSYNIAIRYYGRTLLMLFTLAFIVVILAWNKTMMYFLIVIGPGCILYTYSHFCNQIFEKVELDYPEATRPLFKEKNGQDEEK